MLFHNLFMFYFSFDILQLRSILSQNKLYFIFTALGLYSIYYIVYNIYTMYLDPSIFSDFYQPTIKF